jgi:DNA mismatch endonuclease (patch repair protein)
MMSGIRSKNTKPELAIRHALHKLGFRYRLHSARVPGRPDIVLPAHKAAIFVHGCFWHGHDCSFYRTPDTRRDFWLAKINGNRERDRRIAALCTDGDWRRLVIWECAVRGRPPEAIEEVANRAAQWIRSRRRTAEIRGT